MTPSVPDSFIDRLKEALADGSFLRLSLGAYRGSDRSVRKLLVRPVVLKDGYRLSFVWRHDSRDITKNFALEDGVALLQELVGHDFGGGTLHTTTATWQLEFRPGRTTRLTRSAPLPGAEPDLAHDRKKARTLDPNSPWLRELGVTMAGGSVRQGMESKYRQIHRFIEILDPLLDAATFPKSGPIRAMDMGCGKGYLTFAAFEHLRLRFPDRPVEMTGVEMRPELVQLCSKVAQSCRLEGLKFSQGEIGTVTADPVDILIALHACDTATDDAFAWGLGVRGAGIPPKKSIQGTEGAVRSVGLMLVAPCCHKEVRKRINPPPVLAEIYRHGILMEREAEIVTDALRAGILEWAGYSSRVFEFISPEETSKNLMISAVRRTELNPSTPDGRGVRELAAFHGIRNQRLADRLGFSLSEISDS